MSLLRSDRSEAEGGERSASASLRDRVMYCGVALLAIAVTLLAVLLYLNIRTTGHDGPDPSQTSTCMVIGDDTIGPCLHDVPCTVNDPLHSSSCTFKAALRLDEDGRKMPQPLVTNGCCPTHSQSHKKLAQCGRGSLPCNFGTQTMMTMAPEDLTHCSLQESLLPPITHNERVTLRSVTKMSTVDPDWPAWMALDGGLALSPEPPRAEVCRMSNPSNPERCSINGSTGYIKVEDAGPWQRTVNGSAKRGDLPIWVHYTLPFGTPHVTLLPKVSPAAEGRVVLHLDGKAIKTGERANVAMTPTSPTPHNMHFLNITSIDRVYSVVYAFNLSYPVCHTIDTGYVGPGVPQSAICTTTAGTINGSFEWKVDYALQHGCELAGSVTVIPATHTGPAKFVQELECPTAMQSAEAPRVDSMAASRDHWRPWGECHTPQTPSINYHAVKTDDAVDGGRQAAYWWKPARATQAADLAMISSKAKLISTLFVYCAFTVLPSGSFGIATNKSWFHKPAGAWGDNSICTPEYLGALSGGGRTQIQLMLSMGDADITSYRRAFANPAPLINGMLEAISAYDSVAGWNVDWEPCNHLGSATLADGLAYAELLAKMATAHKVHNRTISACVSQWCNMTLGFSAIAREVDSIQDMGTCE